MLAVEPGPAGRLRAAGAARPAAERGRLGDRRAGPGAATGRWPGARSRSRTSSRSPACRPAAAARPSDPGAGRGRRGPWCAGCAPPGPRCSPPPSAWSTRPGSRTPRSATPATPATRPVPRAGPPAGRPRSSRRACATWPSAPTPAGRSGSRPPTAASSGSSRATGCCRVAGVFPLSPSLRPRRARSPPPWPAPRTCWPPLAERRRTPGHADRPGRGGRPAIHRRRPGRPARRSLGHPARSATARPPRALAALARGRLAAQGADRALAGRAWPRGRTCSPSSSPGRRRWCTGAGTPAATPRARGPCWTFGASVSDDQYAARARPPGRTHRRDRGEPGRASTSWPGPPSATRRRSRTRRSGPATDNGEGRFTGPYNLTGHPAVSLPVPAAGLPAGLQLAGRRGADAALLRVGRGGGAPDRGTRTLAA